VFWPLNSAGFNAVLRCPNTSLKPSQNHVLIPYPGRPPSTFHSSTVFGFWDPTSCNSSHSRSSKGAKNGCPRPCPLGLSRLLQWATPNSCRTSQFLLHPLASPLLANLNTTPSRFDPSPKRPPRSTAPLYTWLALRSSLWRSLQRSPVPATLLRRFRRPSPDEANFDKEPRSPSSRHKTARSRSRSAISLALEPWEMQMLSRTTSQAYAGSGNGKGAFAMLRPTLCLANTMSGFAHSETFKIDGQLFEHAIKGLPWCSSGTFASTVKCVHSAQHISICFSSSSSTIVSMVGTWTRMTSKRPSRYNGLDRFVRNGSLTTLLQYLNTVLADKFNLRREKTVKPVLEVDDLILLLTHHWAQNTLTFLTKDQQLTLVTIMLLLMYISCWPAELVDAAKHKAACSEQVYENNNWDSEYKSTDDSQNNNSVYEKLKF